METTNHTQDLIATIEALRSQRYSDLPAVLVARILETEANFLENQPEASKRIARLVEAHLNEEKE